MKEFNICNLKTPSPRWYEYKLHSLHSISFWMKKFTDWTKSKLNIVYMLRFYYIHLGDLQLGMHYFEVKRNQIEQHDVLSFIPLWTTPVIFHCQERSCHLIINSASPLTLYRKSNTFCFWVWNFHSSERPSGNCLVCAVPEIKPSSEGKHERLGALCYGRCGQ